MVLKDRNLFYVGGVVRDEILGVSSLDIDYTFQGNAIEFAKELNVIKVNKDFGTVRVFFDGKEIDIASTRIESYPRKGHLPVINKIGCSLKEDLKRRDFTINAMAKRTSDDEFVDYYGGKFDIEDKKLRVLHENSFVDDPSRIIRGLKFSVRFGFELDNNTKKLQNDYLNNINYDMSYHRLKKELKETFNLNRDLAFEKFLSQGIYKLLGENQKVPKINGSIEELIKKMPCENVWLIYMSFFDLSNFELTRAEKRVLEWNDKLKTQSPNNNTPRESIIFNMIRECKC